LGIKLENTHTLMGKGGGREFFLREKFIPVRLLSKRGIFSFKRKKGERELGEFFHAEFQLPIGFFVWGRPLNSRTAKGGKKQNYV